MLVIALLVHQAGDEGFDPSPSTGGGGAGPAGGGGGSGGSGGSAAAARSLGERLRFVSVRRPQPAAAVAADVSQVAPQVPQPQEPVPPVTTPASTAADLGLAAADPSGSGEGDAGAGSGPGTGGGVGSGIGTGRGSGVGPGTGGGPGDRYPPTPTQFFLPPLPAPERIKPYHLIAWFEVDERGNARLLRFNPSRDASYNRRLREVLLTLRFRPAVLADGTPVRDTVDVHYIF